MIYKKDTTLGQTKEFDAQIQVLDIPNEIKVVLTNWLRALWTFRMPYLGTQVEDGQGDWRQEDGRSSCSEVERNGSVLFPASATIGLRQLQELRGSLSHCLHGW